MPKQYVISVGRARIEEGISGMLDQRSKQPLSKTPVMIPVGGYFIPATSMVWGQRVIDGKPRANKSTISATDMDYKGEIKFMEWGTHGGEKILIQFLDGCSSLDKVYQEKRLNMVASNEESSIQLDQGENNFNYDSEEVKINFLKVTSLNGDSKSKDPRVTEAVFREVSELDKYSEKGISDIEKEFKAIELVMGYADKTSELKSLFAIMGGEKVLPDVNDPKNERQIYPALLRFAKINFNEFFRSIENYNKKVSSLFLKGESFELLDYTTDGVISISLDGKKKEVLRGIDAKGDAMKDWVMLNYLSPNVYSAMSQLESDLKNIK